MGDPRGRKRRSYRGRRQGHNLVPQAALDAWEQGRHVYPSQRLLPRQAEIKGRWTVGNIRYRGRGQVSIGSDIFGLKSEDNLLVGAVENVGLRLGVRVPCRETYKLIVERKQLRVDRARDMGQAIAPEKGP